jgi:hypothetical protein
MTHEALQERAKQQKWMLSNGVQEDLSVVGRIDAEANDRFPISRHVDKKIRIVKIRPVKSTLEKVNSQQGERDSVSTGSPEKVEVQLRDGARFVWPDRPDFNAARRWRLANGARSRRGAHVCSPPFR